MSDTFGDSTAAVNQLARGLSTVYSPDLIQSQKLLAEITANQHVIIETLQQENAKFAECNAVTEVTQTMDRAKLYQTKLINIKKDMLSLMEKTTQLKKRALRIQQQKQKEALQAEQLRDRELEKERQLIARDVFNRRT